MYYGIANKSGQVTRSEAVRMLQLAEAHGIDTLDTAAAYGKSEVCLGEITVREFRVVTKLPQIPSDCADISNWVHRKVGASLSRLGVRSLYGLLVHDASQLRKACGGELYKALLSARDDGLVRKIGVSVYSPADLAALIPQYRFDIVQAPFNVIDRRLATTDWLRRLKDMDVEVHTRSAFLQGLLLMKKEIIPTIFAPWSTLWTRWHDWLVQREISAVEACLEFPLAFPEIDRVIVGADNVDQLQEIVDAATTAFPINWPDVSCDDENLINPSRWSKL